MDSIDVLESIESHKVAIVTGATGCGKSTCVPLKLLPFLPRSKRILCVQPRRVAAVSLAHRVARLLDSSDVGGLVGYRMRGDAKDSAETQLLYITCGYLRTLLCCDPAYLRDVSHVILDEAHERSIECDFLFFIVKWLVSRVALDVKVIVMSATIDTSQFVSYFSSLSADPIPVFDLGSEPRFPVKEVYLEDLTEEPQLGGLVAETIESLDRGISEFGDLNSSLIDLVAHLAISRSSSGHCTLIFLPGESAIESVEKRILEQTNDLSVFILHSLVPIEEQRMALRRPSSPQARHVILATNIAESSLTVEGVNLVIDTGLRRESVLVDKIKSLRTVWASRANMAQRKGRTGRVCEGTVIRLFTRDFESKNISNFEIPEKTNLDLIFLSAKFLSERWTRTLGSQLGNLYPSFIVNGLLSFRDSDISLTLTVENLFRMGVLKEAREDSELTMLGSLASWIQIDPQHSKLIYLSLCQGWLVEGIVMAAAMSSERDIFKHSSRFQTWREKIFADRVVSSALHRLHYDTGFCSDLIMVRNLLVSCLVNRAMRTTESDRIFSVPFQTQGIFLSELDSFRNACNLITRCVRDWLRLLIGDTPEPSKFACTVSNDEKTVLISREKVDSIFKFLGRDVGSDSSRSSQTWIEQQIRNCDLFIDMLNFRKRSSYSLSDLSKLFLPLKTFEEADILKLLVTIASDPEHVLSTHASFPRCDGEAMAVKGGNVREVISTLTGGIEPIFVQNQESRVSLVASGFSEPEVNELKGIESSGIYPHQHSEYSSVTCSMGVRIILSVFEKSWRIDVGLGNETVRVFKPYVYNICRWMQQGDSRVYLSPRNPTGWLETRSGTDDDVVFSRNSDGRRSSLARRYHAVVGRLSSGGVVPHTVRAECVTVLPIRNNGRVALGMLLCMSDYVSTCASEDVVCETLIDAAQLVGNIFKHLLWLPAADHMGMFKLSSQFREATGRLLDITNGAPVISHPVIAEREAEEVRRDMVSVRMRALRTEIDFWFDAQSKRSPITVHDLSRLLDRVHMEYL